MSDDARARFRATVHYDGSAFHGWQLQPDAPTVQGALERAVSRVLDEPTRIHAAGRTDAGVHAAGQEIAVDAPARWTAAELRRALNAVTPPAVWLEKLSRAPEEFHPRFDATGRRYEYLVGVRDDAVSPLRAGRIWPLARPLDPARLAGATRRLPGERSFEAFAKSGQPERGTFCRVEEARWGRTAAGDLAFRIVADRFLHHMVRYLVRTLIETATGERDPGELEALLAGAPGPRPPAPAPAEGLYLTGVRYPAGWNRPAGVPGFPLAEEDEGGESGGDRDGAAESAGAEATDGTGSRKEARARR